MVTSVIKFRSDITNELYDSEGAANAAEIQYMKESTQDLIANLAGSTYFNLAITDKDVWPQHPNLESDIAFLHRRAISSALSTSSHALDRNAFGILVDPTKGALRADKWDLAVDFNNYYPSHEFMYIRHMWYITLLDDREKIVEHVKRIDPDLYNALKVTGKLSVFGLDKGLVFVDQMHYVKDPNTLSYMVCMHVENLISSQMKTWCRTLTATCPLFGSLLSMSGG